MPKSPFDMEKAIISNLPEKTGRSLEEWLKILKQNCTAERRKEMINWLKSKHGLGYVTAQTIVGRALKPADYRSPSKEELIDAQYLGLKSTLRLIYDRLVKEALKLGKDIEIGARKTYVSFSRGHQFAIIQASTKDRVDLGLVLRGANPTDRLQEAGSFGSGNVIHRIAIASIKDVDDKLLGWLRAAYEKSAR